MTEVSILNRHKKDAYVEERFTSKLQIFNSISLATSSAAFNAIS